MSPTHGRGRPVARLRATLPGLDLDRILGRVLDVILDQGGDWDATEAILVREFSGGDLDQALTYATGYLIVYAEPEGIAFLRGMRDRRLIPAVPPRRGWGRFRAAG